MSVQSHACASVSVSVHYMRAVAAREVDDRDHVEIMDGRGWLEVGVALAVRRMRMAVQRRMASE